MSKTDGAMVRIEGPAGTLPIMKSDRLARQMAMLFECKCLGKPVEGTVEKYGYSRQRYFQIVNSFTEGGTAALVPKKTGPKGNHVRTQDVVTQIIRHKFLDPDASEEVITQRLRQSGVAINTVRHDNCGESFSFPSFFAGVLEEFLLYSTSCNRN